MERNTSEDRREEQQVQEVEQELLRRFLAKERRVPKRPAFSRTSTLIVRKEWLPFYYAIYDHALKRFVELQYRNIKNGPLRTVPVPAERQPPVPEEP